MSHANSPTNKITYVQFPTNNPRLNQAQHFVRPGLKVINLEFILKLKIKRNDWLLADMCPQVANHCAYVSASSQSLRFILSMRMISSFITLGPDLGQMGGQWLSGRVLDSRLRGCGFEPHSRPFVVSLSKTH